MRKPKAHNLQLLADIRALMRQGKNSQEIMDLLGIPLRSYRRYTKSIFLQQKDIWYSMVKNELATELLALRNSLEETFTKSQELANTPGLGTGDVLAALNSQNSARLSIVQLICEGTELLTKQYQEPKYHKSQSNIMMQASQPHP